MDYARKYRIQYPDIAFETRALPEVDGGPLLMTLEPWYWKSLDIYIKETSSCLTDITQFCFNFAKNRITNEPDKNLDEEFYLTFTYFIYGGYFRLIKSRNKIANDFWKPID